MLESVSENRRRQERAVVNSAVKVRSVGARDYSAARAIDISLDGMGLLVPQRLVWGSKVQLRCGDCQLEATVARCVQQGQQYHVGLQLQFRSMADRFPYQQIVAAIG